MEALREQDESMHTTEDNQTAEQGGPVKHSDILFDFTYPVGIMVIGTCAEGLPLLKAIQNTSELRLTGVLDTSMNRETLELCRELGISFWTGIDQVQGAGQPDIILDVNDNEESRQHTESLAAKKTLVLHGPTVKLIYLLVRGYQSAHENENKYRLSQREFDLYSCRDKNIIGKSKAIEKVTRLIEMVAQTPTTVLLLGKTGTGKDLVARSIYRASSLNDKPFITVNCTALTSSLIESELFGYVKGAFTGAEKDCRGLLEEADNGTIFLDEIGDMKLELQAKMLRFLQTGEIRPVGSPRIKHVDVRVIAATNRDLHNAIENGTFRQDLFYRFNTFTIELPDLNERREDIPYLAYHFLTKAEAKLNTKMQGISDEAIDVMMQYDWPGNVRELENVIERAVIVSTNNVIMPDDLSIITSGTCIKRKETASSARIKLKTSRDRLTADHEKHEITRYLQDAGGNVSQASRLSGIPRRTLYRLMEKHGINRKQR
jgi:transcriptional regulator with GAF, ATPase, and Fis domain